MNVTNFNNENICICVFQYNKYVFRYRCCENNRYKPFKVFSTKPIDPNKVKVERVNGIVFNVTVESDDDVS